MHRLTQKLFPLHPGADMPAGGRILRRSAIGFPADAKEISSLGRLAFAFLWLLVFAIPWENAVVIAGIGTIARLLGLLAGVFGILAIMERASISLPSIGHILMTLFVMWAAASCLWTVSPDLTLTAAVVFLQLLALAWLIWEFARRDRAQRSLMKAYVLGTYVSGIDTLYRYFFSSAFKPTERYVSTGFNANDLALVMALSIPVSCYLAVHSRGLMVWVYRMQLVLAGTTVLLTASRAGLLASLVALAFVPWTFARLPRLQRIANFLTIAVLACSALLFVPATSWERLSTTQKELTEGTLGERTLIWEAGWEAFRGHPYRGVGAGAFRDSVARILGEPLVAHNTFLSVLVEEGVIGFGLFLALIVFLVVCAWELPPLPHKLWVVILGVWVVGVCSASWEGQKPTWFFFSLLVAQWAGMVRTRPNAGRVLCFIGYRPRLLSE